MVSASAWVRVHVCKYPHLRQWACFPMHAHMCNARTRLSLRVSDFGLKASPGLRPLESSACEGQVWFREETRQIGMEMESAVFVPNVQTDWLLITSKPLLSSHRPLLLLHLLRLPLHTNMRVMQKTVLFNNHHVKLCLHEWGNAKPAVSFCKEPCA